MAVRPPSSPGRKKSGYGFVFVIGLLALALGVVFLLLSFRQREYRAAGAGLLLFGVVFAGGYLTNRLLSDLYADPLAYEPPWAKLGRGEGPPRLPPPGKAAAPVSTPFAIDKLIDFPAPEAPRRAPPPVARAAPKPAAPIAWTEDLFNRLSPHQFDAVCEALFAQGGFETRVQSHGVAGGVTIWLHSRHAQDGKDRPAAVALCKLWQGQPVGVRELHPLLNLMAARGLKRATYATASSYTENASKFAKYNGINALDRAGLLKLIAMRTPAQQQALLAAAITRR